MNQIFTNFKSSGRTTIKKTFLVFFFSTFSFFLAFAQGFDAFSNPKVNVNIAHPPGLGIKINKVAFNLASGNCADQIINEMISDFVSNGVEVIDRDNLNAILAEHDLNFSGYVDKNSAVSIGKIIGPSALISVKVLRCQAEINDKLYADERRYNSTTKQYYNVRAYIAKTTFYLKASIQTTDLTTGRIFTAKIFDYAPMMENKSYTGRPAAPSEFSLQETAFRYLTYDVHKMFFAWNERDDLYFFDDKDGGLKEAFKALKDGNHDLAFDLSKQNLETCKNTPGMKDKIVAHAYYNVGLMYFLQNNYDEAIPYFRESEKLRPGSIVTDAINTCLKAKSLNEEMQKVDDKAAIEIEKSNKESLKAEKNQLANTLTNTDVISLTEMKLSPKLIINKIKTSPCKFDTSPAAMVELTNKGVAEDVIIAMMEK